MPGKDILFQRGPADLQHRVRRFRRNAEPLVSQDRRRSVPGVEFMVQTRKDHYGELQTLGLVDGHDPDGASLAGCCLRLSEIRIVFFQKLDIADKIVQPPVACAFKIFRLHHQHVQVGLPYFPSGKSGSIRLSFAFAGGMCDAP